MRSKRYVGVRFRCYSNDHLPVHFHAKYGRLTVIIELTGGIAFVSDRKDAVKPRGGSRSAIRHIVKVAQNNYEALIAQWSALHEKEDGR